MVLALKGRKSSSSSKKATRHDDNLFGTDTVELLLAISEGPIDGLVDGAASFNVGGVPLLDKGSQTPNISNFELRLLKGTNPADSIRLNLGGLGATKNVGLDLRVADQKIVVQGDKTQIDYIDVRMVVQRLLDANDEGGEFPTSLQFKIEVKPRSSGVWQIPFNNEPPPPVENTSGASNYRPGTNTPGTIVNDAYRETYIQPTAPTAASDVGAMWFNTETQFWTPSIWNGQNWQVPGNLQRGERSGYIIWTWEDLGGRTAWFAPDGSTPPPGTLAAGDYLLTPNSGAQVYSYNETAWVGAQNWGTPTVRGPGVIEINGLTRSAYPKEYRIPVARINEPYDVRVTRISPASTKNTFRDVNFESIQEVDRDVVSFPDLALAWLTIKATDTFTSIPDFTGVYRGLVIPVPSNHVYDPVTKQCSFPGFWDGAFKMAYTNSPAWHAYNFIMNSRYGKNSYYPEVADKYDYYDFGKHCAAHGFRFNEYIQEARSLNELINYIVGIAGGRYVDRGDGYSTVLWDADDQPAIAIFAPENTIEGSFTYSFTDITERKNDFKVSFKNPELNHREDRLRVWDQNSIEVNGRNPEEFVAVGCRDADEAVKRGRLRLATALTEKTIANFKTNRLGRYLLPFQVILLADDQSWNVISGRVLNPDPLPAGTTILPLRDPVYFEAGVSYSVSFTASDGEGGLKIVQYPLTVPVPGLQSVLRLSQALTEPLPEFAVFSIGTPKAFRVTNISQSEDEPDNLDITCIEVNRLKWAFVDGKVTLRDILAVQTGPLSKFVYPVSGARITPESTLDGHFNLVATWNPSDTKLVRGYRVYQSINAGPMELVYEGSVLQYRIADARAATYTLSIVAVGLDGTTESAPVTVSYIVANAGTIRSVQPPSNLRLVNEPKAPIFEAIDPVFTWDAAPDPLVTKYRVEVLGATNNVVHTEFVSGDLRFTYTLAANTADNGGAPLRQFTVRLRSVDTTGNTSVPISLVVSHPAPPAVIPSLLSANSAIIVSFNPTTADYQGALTFIETVHIPVPPITAPKADSKNPTVFYPGQAGVLYYVRVALYDSYGRTGLNYSDELSILARDSIVDVVAPVIPDAPVVTSQLVVAADGRVSATARAVWTQNPSSNFGAFETRARLRGTGDWTQYPAGVELSQTWENLPVGVLFEVQVRAINKDGFAASGWSLTGSTLTPTNAAPPGAVTGLTVTATNLNAFLRWVNPSNNDLDYIEVYAADTNDVNKAVRVATVSAPGSTWQDSTLAVTGSRFYWVRPFNSSKVGATTTTGPAQATSTLITAGQLAADAITSTLAAQKLDLIGNVNALPAVAGYAGPSTLNYQGKLYTIQSGAWKPIVSATTAADIIGKLAAGQLDIDGVRAATLTAGAIKGEMIAAGALTADKAGFGLATGNLIWNSDFALGGWFGGWPNGVTNGTAEFRWNGPDWQAYRLSGTKNLCIRTSGAPPRGQQPYIDLHAPNEDGTPTALIPIQGGQTYEVSAYLSVHRCFGTVACYFHDGANYIDGHTGNDIGTNYAGGNLGGAPDDSWRSRMIVKAPANARGVLVRIIMTTTGESEPYVFASGVYMAICAPGTRTIEGNLPADPAAYKGAYSPYTVQSRTIISGGQLSARSIDAAGKITAGSMATDLFTANSIDAKILNVDTLYARVISSGWVTADVLQVGTNENLRSVINGSSTTKIQGGAIAANSITANLLKIGSRGIQTVDIEFYIERGAIGAPNEGVLTNVVAWTAGHVLYTDNAGVQRSNYVPAGRVGIDGGYWYIWWCLRTPDAGFYTAKDNWGAVMGDQDNVLMASVAGVTGLSVFGGAGFIVDGDRVTARSIRADKIAVNSLTADLIQARTVFAQTVFVGGKTRTSDGAYNGIIGLEGESGRIYINDHNDTVNRVILGNITPWLGAAPSGLPRYGMVVYNEQNQLIFSTGGVPKEALTGQSGMGNILPNATGEFQVAGWASYSSVATQGLGLRPYQDEYDIQGARTFNIYAPGVPAPNNIIDFVARSLSGERITALPGERYEASAYVNAHRANGEVLIAFFNYAGTLLYQVSSGQNPPNNVGQGRYLSQYQRIGVFGTAPAGTEYIELIVRGVTIGQSDPYLMFCKPYLGRAQPNQSELSPWSPGMQAVSITGSNISTYIQGAIIGDAQVGSLSAGKISVTQLSAFSANLGTVTAGLIRSADGRMQIDLNNNRMVFSD